jgi:DNA-binding NtrC family response regulator
MSRRLETAGQELSQREAVRGGHEGMLLGQLASLLKFKVKRLEESTAEVMAATRRLEQARVSDLQTRALDVLQGISLHDEVRRYERELICAALAHTMGHQLKAARLLGVKATTLNAKIKQYGISARSYQTSD